MSTKSRIAMKQKDNTYISIVCHFDGYLENNGKLLYDHYKDSKKVDMLLHLGDISSLERNVFPNISKPHNKNQFQPEVTISYHRDYGEDLNFEINNDVYELINECCLSDQSYLYVFEDEKWKFADVRTKWSDDVWLENLEDKLLSKNIISIANNRIDYFSDSLSNELVKYEKDLDTYEFNDMYSMEEDAYNDIQENLSSVSGIDSIIENLCNDIHSFASENDLSNPDILDLSRTAFNLLGKLNQYSKAMTKEKNNDNELVT